MATQAKICGLRDKTALEAAVSAGAAYVGFVFYPRSPRHVSVESAAQLARDLPVSVQSVALLVDPDDALVAHVVETLMPSLLQLHGRETPERVTEIRRQTGRPVMKAIPVAEPADVDRASHYEAVADRLLFDAKPPAKGVETLPGGNGLKFDWRLLQGRQWRVPWMLSGGLDPQTVGMAIELLQPPAVDVSSGVEIRRGHKDPKAIAAFLAAVRAADKNALP